MLVVPQLKSNIFSKIHTYIGMCEQEVTPFCDLQKSTFIWFIETNTRDYAIFIGELVHIIWKTHLAVKQGCGKIYIVPNTTSELDATLVDESRHIFISFFSDGETNKRIYPEIKILYINFIKMSGRPVKCF